jgi:hypothetical protein
MPAKIAAAPPCQPAQSSRQGAAAQNKRAALGTLTEAPATGPSQARPR